MGSCKDVPNMESDVSLDDENLWRGGSHLGLGFDHIEVELLKVIKMIRKLEYRCLCSEHNPVGIPLSFAKNFTLMHLSI